MKVRVTIKDAFVGDVMGDINKRRGRVLEWTKELVNKLLMQKSSKQKLLNMQLT